MARVHRGGVLRGGVPGATRAVRLPACASTYPGGHAAEIDDPYRYGRVITEYDVYLFAQGKHTRIYDKLGAHLMRIGEADGVHFARLGAQRRSRQRRRRLQRVGRPRAPDAAARRRPACGRSSSPASPKGERYKFEIRSTPARRAAAQDRSVSASRFEMPPMTAVDRDARATTRGATPQWFVDRAGRNAWFDTADGDLRSPPRLVGARAGRARSLPDLPRAGRPADSLREGDGLHAHRAAAGDGAPVLRRRGATRSPASSRRPAASARRDDFKAFVERCHQARHRRHPRLGARPLSRRTRTGWRASTARRSTSTRIRGRGSTATGAR